MFDLVIRSDRVVTPAGIGACDVAVEGEKIAAVAAAGTIGADRTRRLIDATGKIVMPGGIDPHTHLKWYTPNSDGTVTYTQPGQTAATVAGQIQLALFPNPAGLNSIGQNMFLPTDASGDAAVANPGSQEGLGTLLQGYVEGSNVSVVEEFINMIVSQRAYEANSKVVKAADEMYQQINNVTQ